MSEDPKHLIDSINIKFKELMSVIHHQYPNVIFPPIAITYEPCGTLAGWAKPLSYQINLNPGLLIDHPDYIINNTLGHELAHIVVSHVYGFDVETDHGDRWKYVMQLLNIASNDRHHLDTTKFRRQITRYQYQCKCAGKLGIHELSTQANKKAMTQISVFTCTRCKATLIPMQPVVVNNILPSNMQHETKINKAWWIIKTYPNLPKNELLQLLIEGAGLTKQGASTYYYKLKACLA
jgi:SprT protein